MRAYIGANNIGHNRQAKKGNDAPHGLLLRNSCGFNGGYAWAAASPSVEHPKNAGALNQHILTVEYVVTNQLHEFVKLFSGAAPSMRVQICSDCKC